MPIAIGLRFVRLPAARKLLLLDAAWQLALAWLLLWVLPFRRLTRSLGQAQVESPAGLTPNELVHARQVKWAIRAIVRRLPRPPRCLVQAVSAQWMLRRRHAASTLYLGVARDPSQNLNAHAWVRCGELLITGGGEHQNFTVVGCFA